MQVFCRAISLFLIVSANSLATSSASAETGRFCESVNANVSIVGHALSKARLKVSYSLTPGPKFRSSHPISVRFDYITKSGLKTYDALLLEGYAKPGSYSFYGEITEQPSDPIEDVAVTEIKCSGD